MDNLVKEILSIVSISAERLTRLEGSLKDLTEVVRGLRETSLPSDEKIIYLNNNSSRCVRDDQSDCGTSERPVTPLLVVVGATAEDVNTSLESVKKGSLGSEKTTEGSVTQQHVLLMNDKSEITSNTTTAGTHQMLNLKVISDRRHSLEKSVEVENLHSDGHSFGTQRYSSTTSQRLKSPSIRSCLGVHDDVGKLELAAVNLSDQQTDSSPTLEKTTSHSPLEVSVVKSVEGIQQMGTQIELKETSAGDQSAQQQNGFHSKSKSSSSSVEVRDSSNSILKETLESEHQNSKPQPPEEVMKNVFDCSESTAPLPSKSEQPQHENKLKNSTERTEELLRRCSQSVSEPFINNIQQTADQLRLQNSKEIPTLETEPEWDGETDHIPENKIKILSNTPPRTHLSEVPEPEQLPTAQLLKTDCGPYLRYFGKRCSRTTNDLMKKQHLEVCEDDVSREGDVDSSQITTRQPSVTRRTSNSIRNTTTEVHNISDVTLVESSSHSTTTEKLEPTVKEDDVLSNDQQSKDSSNQKRIDIRESQQHNNIPRRSPDDDVTESNQQLCEERVYLVEDENENNDHNKPESHTVPSQESKQPTESPSEEPILRIENSSKTTSCNPNITSIPSFSLQNKLETIPKNSTPVIPIKEITDNSEGNQNISFIHTENTQRECLICLEELKIDIYTLSCGHCYHISCISKALALDYSNPYCGTCRKSLLHVEVRNINREAWKLKMTKLRKQRMQKRTRLPPPPPLRQSSKEESDSDRGKEVMEVENQKVETTTMSQFDRMLGYQTPVLKRPKRSIGISPTVLHKLLEKKKDPS